jgi:DNA repair exonuclease SbcCD ATPase subunit
MARKTRTAGQNGLSKAIEQPQAQKPDVSKRPSREEEFKALEELQQEQQDELDRNRKDLQEISDRLKEREKACEELEKQLAAREAACDEIEAAHRAAMEADDTSCMVRAISVRTRTGKEFRRCGYVFGGEPLDIPISEIEPKALERLRGEPALRIKDIAVKI